MRLYSLRARVLFFSAVFAVLLVGSLTFATYLVMSDAMQRSAEDAAVRLSSLAARAYSKVASDAGKVIALETRGEDLGAAEREALTLETIIDTLPTFLAIGGAEGGSFALYARETSESPLAVVWKSDDRALEQENDHRESAARGRYPVRHTDEPGRILSGLLASSALGTSTTHLPVQLPGGGIGVMDIVYYPTLEEGVLDSARLPMLLISMFAIFVSILMMQIIMGWVLSLVGTLRKAADSVDAGHLSVRLPESGSREMSELSKSLNALIDRLRKRADMQTRFVADASHELATPVAGIRGYINILKNWGAEDPEMRAEAIGAIDRESQRMARLTSNLLALIRSEGILETRTVRFDVNAAAREVLANAATRYMGKDLEFVGPDEGALWLEGDPEHVEEVLAILVDNACKYTNPGGRVQVSTRRQRDRVIVDVIDTGIGISEEDLPNIFERFYRSDRSRGGGAKGFGLGLPIAKYLVTANGGTLWVRSTLGEGTTFSVSLPRKRQKDAQDA